jgi:hypothetical protein
VGCDESRAAERGRAGATIGRGPRRNHREPLYCFGDYDLVGVVDFPDNRTVAAWSMAVSSGGDVRAFKTTSLLTIEEGLHALGQASEVAHKHRPPTAPS